MGWHGIVCLYEVSADSINILKSRLDKVWYYHDLKFDWKAEISGM